MEFSRNFRKTMVRDALSYIGFQKYYDPQPYIISSIRKKSFLKIFIYILSLYSICEYLAILNIGFFFRNCSGSEIE